MKSFKTVILICVCTLALSSYAGSAKNTNTTSKNDTIKTTVVSSQKSSKSRFVTENPKNKSNWSKIKDLFF